MSSSASIRWMVRTDALGATSLVNSQRGSRLAFFDSLTTRLRVQVVISQGLAAEGVFSWKSRLSYRLRKVCIVDLGRFISLAI